MLFCQVSHRPNAQLQSGRLLLQLLGSHVRKGSLPLLLGSQYIGHHDALLTQGYCLHHNALLTQGYCAHHSALLAQVTVDITMQC